MEDLFVDFKQATSENAILLIDASISVVMSKFGNGIVWDEMLRVVQTFEHEKFYVLYWNSNNVRPDDKLFKEGIFKYPYIIPKDKLSQQFQYVKTFIKGSCMTHPHIAFNDLYTSTWIDPKALTTIYYVTDGEITANMENELSKSIEKLFKKYNNIILKIVTVDNVIRDFTQVEQLANAAGSDVYKIVMEHKLTKYVAQFISFSPNNPQGFMQIDRQTHVATGFVPYGNRCFSELKTGKFIMYLQELINTNMGHEDELIKIIQNLSVTLSVLTKDKPKHVVHSIIDTFCDLFSETTLDPVFTKFILLNAVEKESEGMADVYAVYRSKLKDFYKQANMLSERSVKNAIGIQEFITLPVDGKIITGSSNFISENPYRDGKYNDSTIVLQGVRIPVLPIITRIREDSSTMSEQCTRQWTRMCVSAVYNVHYMSDSILFIVLALNLQIQMSNMDAKIKNAYRNLAIIMLRKKRLNSDCTEISKIELGELMLPNSGNVAEFNNNLVMINRLFNFNVKNMTLWYAMCLALDNEPIKNKQFFHCNEDMFSDFGDIDPNDLLVLFKARVGVNFTHFEIPFEASLDYTCLVTLDDLSDAGGYRFRPHQTNTRAQCFPRNTISEDGLQALKRANNMMCPICYAYLTEHDFIQVGPKNDIDIVFTPEFLQRNVPRAAGGAPIGAPAEA